MPVLVGLVTYLALTGTPGLAQAPGAKTEDTGAKENLTGITGLTPGGLPGRSYGTFAAKAEALEDSRSVVDTYRLALQMGDVSAIDALLTDTYRLAIDMSGYSLPAKEASDRYVPVLTLTQAALDKSTVTPRAGADSYVPVVTMTATLPVEQKVVADSYVPTLAMTVTVSTSAAVVLTDSYVPVIGMDPYVQGIQGAVARAVLDSYVPTLGMTVRLAIAGEVDDIKINDRPYGLIRIEEA